MRFLWLSQTSIWKRFHSNEWMNVVIWVVGILLMTALAIKDFLPLLAEYTSNNKATQVSFNRDSSFKPPRIVQIIPFYINDDSLMTIARHLINDTEECNICGRLESEGWAVWKEVDLSKFGNDSLASLYSALTLHFAKKLLSDIEEDKEHVLNNDKFSPWNTPLIISAMKLFIYLNDIDIWYDLKEFNGAMKNDLIEILDSFKNTKTLDLLFTQIVQTFCQNIRFRDFGENAVNWAAELDSNISCNDLLLNRNLPAFFDAKPVVLFALPDSGVSKVKNYHFTLVEGEAFSWIQRPEVKPGSFKIYGDISALYITTLDTHTPSNIYKTEKDKYGLNITVRYGIKARARDARPGRAACNNETTDTCQSKCIKQIIIEKCRCVPPTIKRGLIYYRDLPYCTYSTMYNECNITAMVRADMDSQCSEKCQDSCEYISYNWQISESSYNPPGNQSEFNLILSPMDESFTEFTWIEKISLEQFISQIGGLVNFYLGFSGLSLVHFVTVCVNFLRQRLLRGKRIGEESTGNFRVRPDEDKNETIQVENIGECRHCRHIELWDRLNEVMPRIYAITSQLSEVQSEIKALKMNSKQRRF